MTKRMKSVLVWSAVAGILTLSGEIPSLHSTVPPQDPGRMAPAFVAAARAKRPVPLPRISEQECAALALKATVAKARAEMRRLVPTPSNDLAGIGAAMNADRRLAESVQQTFAVSDLVKSEYTRRGECVVTVALPLERLQKIVKDL